MIEKSNESEMGVDFPVSEEHEKSSSHSKYTMNTKSLMEDEEEEDEEEDDLTRNPKMTAGLNNDTGHGLLPNLHV